MSSADGKVCWILVLFSAFVVTLPHYVLLSFLFPISFSSIARGCSQARHLRWGCSWFLAADSCVGRDLLFFHSQMRSQVIAIPGQFGQTALTDVPRAVHLTWNGMVVLFCFALFVVSVLEMAILEQPASLLQITSPL